MSEFEMREMLQFLLNIIVVGHMGQDSQGRSSSANAHTLTGLFALHRFQRWRCGAIVIMGTDRAECKVEESLLSI